MIGAFFKHRRKVGWVYCMLSVSSLIRSGNKNSQRLASAAFGWAIVDNLCFHPTSLRSLVLKKVSDI